MGRAVTVAIAKIDESKVTDRTDTKDEHDKNESNMRDENVTKTVSETMGTRRMVRRNDGDFEVLVRTVWKEQRGINMKMIRIGLILLLFLKWIMANIQILGKLVQLL